MIGPLIAALGIAGGALGLKTHINNEKAKAEAAAREQEGLIKKAEKIAEQGDHETYESIIPHLRQAGVGENIIDAGRTIARSKAGQIWRQETQAGMEPSVTPPPNILSSLMRGQPGGAESADYFDNATSTDVGMQRGAAGLPPIDTETASFRASAFQPPAQPTPMAQPTTGIQLAQTRGAQTIHTPTGTRSTKEITGKEITDDAIGQARQQGLHPIEVHKVIDIENARRRAKGLPPIETNDAAIITYDLEHFEKTMTNIQRDLESQGMPPTAAMGQAIQQAYEQTHLIPEKYKAEIVPKPGQLAAGAYINAMQRAGAVSAVVKDPKALPPGFLSDYINQTPNLSPEDSTRAHHAAAQGLMQQLIPKLKTQYPTLSDTQIMGRAAQLAAYAVGGQVPQQWTEAVMGNPTAFGYSPEQAGAMAASGINPLEPGAGAKAQDVISDITLKKDFRKAYIEKAQTPEGAAAAYDELQRKATPAPATTQTPGQIDRTIQKEQKGALSRQDREQEQEFSKTPSGEIDKLTALDNIYTTGVRLQQLAVQKDPQGKTLLEKYGDYPGTFIEWYRKASGALGNTDPQLRKYTDLLGKIFNIEKKTFAGVAVNVAERKDLLQFMPDPGDNVRTGLMKINDLVQTTDLELANKIEYYKTNYPKTDFTSFGHQKIRSARAAQKAK